jgi:hypothetical protein
MIEDLLPLVNICISLRQVGANLGRNPYNYHRSNFNV